MIVRVAMDGRFADWTYLLRVVTFNVMLANAREFPFLLGRCESLTKGSPARCSQQ